MNRSDTIAEEELDSEISPRGAGLSADVVPDPILKGAIDRLPVRHRLNQLFILWPPLVSMLNSLARCACTTHATGAVETAMTKALLSGLRAADNVKDYTAPQWPLRVVDAFGTEAVRLIGPLLGDSYSYVPVAGPNQNDGPRSLPPETRCAASVPLR